MVSLAPPPPASQPAARHGTCKLRLIIGGTTYSLRPIKGQPRGLVVWALRALDGPREGVTYQVAIVNRVAGCTCPDHEINGHACKHLMSLRAIGLVPKSALTAGETAARETARSTRRPAKALKKLAGQLHQPAAASAGRDPLAHARRKHTAVKPAAPPASPFVAGWNSAVSQRVAALSSQGGA